MVEMLTWTKKTMLGVGRWIRRRRRRRCPVSMTREEDVKYMGRGRHFVGNLCE